MRILVIAAVILVSSITLQARAAQFSCEVHGTCTCTGGSTSADCKAMSRNCEDPTALICEKTGTCHCTTWKAPAGAATGTSTKGVTSGAGSKPPVKGTKAPF
jgi:hypothetical protein